MKKFVYALALLPLAFGFTACDDDDNNVPNVDVTASVTGGKFAGNGVIEVEQGTDLVVTGLTLENHTGREAAIGAVEYFIDGFPVGTSLVAPYGITLPTAGLDMGRHVLLANFPVYVVDYPVCSGYLRYDIDIVEPSQAPDAGSEANPLTLRTQLRHAD